MTTDAIRSTAFELGEISRKLSAIEVAGYRKMTPANAREILEWHESLCSFDRTDIRLAGSMGVDLPAILAAGLSQLATTIELARKTVGGVQCEN